MKKSYIVMRFLVALMLIAGWWVGRGRQVRPSVRRCEGRQRSPVQTRLEMAVRGLAGAEPVGSP